MFVQVQELIIATWCTLLSKCTSSPQKGVWPAAQLKDAETETTEVFILFRALICFCCALKQRQQQQHKIHLTSAMCMYLNWMEDGLQHGENITEEEVPGLGQRVKQLLTCVSHITLFTFTTNTVDAQSHSEALRYLHRTVFCPGG